MCQRSTFNLENSKGICYGYSFVHLVTGCNLLRNSFCNYLYLRYTYETLKCIKEIHIAKSVNF